MKRLLIIITIIALLALSAVAQVKQDAKLPAPTAEQQTAFAQAVADSQSAQRDAEAAQARLEAAQAKLQATILRIMAKLKLDPDEWRPVLTDGKLQFEKIEKK